MSLPKNPTQCPWPRVEPRPLGRESNALTTGPLCLPQVYDDVLIISISLGLKAELVIAVINSKGKQRFFSSGSETQTMMNCGHAIVQGVVLLFFPVKC